MAKRSILKAAVARASGERIRPRARKRRGRQFRDPVPGRPMDGGIEKVVRMNVRRKLVSPPRQPGQVRVHKVRLFGRRRRR